ncbi:archease, partial [Candidatus Woesearchaeota archaeon]|jgi:SHS2 domain-containing protein|nr:archease [Candidatus Woesearchaeota archaeon]MBT3438487.1 archease [Candidatus Woesearchaeota archaeon]MBT4058418.1 archease [Candidatus Woesearchaeota archaeon]MBT4733268.1 archease [Candidatus Woesearchaeota archaeon]MBT5042629.1 archease [Candidatus Woesearchaeota archaeon]
MKSYKFLEDIAIADVAFEAKGDSLEEVFIAAAEAVFETNAEIKTVGDSFTHEFKLENKDLEKLFYDFLEEIVYIKDKDGVVFSKSEVKIEEIEDVFKLNSKFYGEKINQEKHELNVDVKAITLHEFSLKKEGNNYVAKVIVDI